MKKRRISSIIAAVLAGLMVTNTAFAYSDNCLKEIGKTGGQKDLDYGGNAAVQGGLKYVSVSPSNTGVYNQLLTKLRSDGDTHCDTNAPIYALRTSGGAYTALSKNSRPSSVVITNGANWVGNVPKDALRKYIKSKRAYIDHMIHDKGAPEAAFYSAKAALANMDPDHPTGNNTNGLEVFCEVVCDKDRCKPDKDKHKEIPSPPRYYRDEPEYKHDKASRSDVAPQQMPKSWTIFDNFAAGTDGYPRDMGYSNEDQPSDGHIEGDKVKTPFGEMVGYLHAGSHGYAKFKNPAPSVEATNAYQQELIAKASSHKARTEKTRTSITIPQNHAISKGLAKGGIVRIQKDGKEEEVDYPSAWKSFYHRDYMRHHYIYCNDQKNGRDVYEWDKKGKPTKWYSCSIKAVAPGYTPWKLITGWISGTTGRGHFTGHYYSQKSGGEVGAAEWQSGCWSETKQQAVVSFPYQSWMHILHYYILNILCNKNDYEHYKALYNEWGWNGGFKEVKQDGTNRFQASMHSPIFRKIGAVDMLGPIFPRMARELAKHGQLSGWNVARVNAMYGNYGGGANDPVYTKECPFADGLLKRRGIAETPTSQPSTCQRA